MSSVVQALAQFVRHYLLALQFFTRIPVTGRLAAWVGFDQTLLRASAAHFPGVGVLVGLLTAGVFGLAVLLLPAGGLGLVLAATLCTVFSVVLTGAFHEDGLADTADGLGGHVSKARALDIMKDSRIGTYGAVALVLGLQLKILLLAVLAEQAGWRFTALFLVLAHGISRAMPLWVVWRLPHVGDTASSKSKPLADHIRARSLLAAGVWLVLILYGAGLWLSWPITASALAAAVLATAWMTRCLRHRLQGFTGDGLGATQQLSELACYGAAVVALGLL